MQKSVSNNLPETISQQGTWANTFSYHPFNIELSRAEGVFLYDSEDKSYIDASGGPMAVNVGHNNPRIKQAIVDQLDRFNYVHPILANRAKAEFCDSIANIAPGSLNATYLVSGGSEAVDTAMKLARQAQLLKGNKDKYKIISNFESYHGMTLATLAISGSPGSQVPFEPMLRRYPQIHQYSDHGKPDDMPRDEWGVICARELEQAIHYAGASTVAAYIATPHGAGCDYGVVPPHSYWKAIRAICDRYDVLLIADEVVTGFGRTGKWFAMEHFKVQADIMTTGKGISGMYAPLGAVTVSDEVNELFADSYFVHGFTSGGHPLAVAAGKATIDVLTDDRLVENSAKLEPLLFSYREKLLSHPTVKDIRGWGLFMVGELVKDKKTMEFFEPKQRAEHLFQQLGLKNGLAMYGTLYGARRGTAFKRGLPFWISPPLSITSEELTEMMERLDQTLTDWEQALGV